jgi:hypothetical protein
LWLVCGAVLALRKLALPSVTLGSNWVQGYWLAATIWRLACKTKAMQLKSSRKSGYMEATLEDAA